MQGTVITLAGKIKEFDALLDKAIHLKRQKSTCRCITELLQKEQAPWITIAHSVTLLH